MPRLLLVPVPGRWSIVPPFPGPLFDSAKIYTGLGVGLRSAFLLGICWPPPRRVSCRCPWPSRTCRRWKSPPGPVASCGTAAPDRSRTSGGNCAGANLPPCLPLAPGGDDPGGPSGFPGLFFSGSSSHLLGSLLGVIRLPVGAFLLSPLLVCLSFPLGVLLPPLYVLGRLLVLFRPLVALLCMPLGSGLLLPPRTFAGFGLSDRLGGRLSVLFERGPPGALGSVLLPFGFRL